jgi:hypothetical protein
LVALPVFSGIECFVRNLFVTVICLREQLFPLWSFLFSSQFLSHGSHRLCPCGLHGNSVNIFFDLD